MDVAQALDVPRPDLGDVARSVRLNSLAGMLVCCLIACPASGSVAAPNCMTRILADVPAEESPEQVKSKSNNEFGPVTKIKVNKTTGRMLYCAGTSYCYNSNAFEFTTPCRIKIDKEGADFGNYFIYFTR